MRLVSRVVWGLARFAAWIFYRIERVGPRPPAGPLLIIANHPNGLLDPVLVVTTSERTPRFLAKSPLFTMPFVGWFVRGSGAIPVYRRQDAGVDVAKNREMFAAVDEALDAGDCVCLFPEGTTHSSGHLEPLKTGAARIVMAAEARGLAVAIVPVGLNLDRKAEMRSTATVSYGRPFFADDVAHDVADRVDALTALMRDRLRDVMVEASPLGEHELVRRIDRIYSAFHRLAPGADAKLTRRRAIASGLQALRERDPRRFDEIVDEVGRYDRRLRRFGLLEQTVGADVSRATALRFAAREVVLFVALMPVVLVGAAAFAVPYRVIDLAVRRLGTHLEEEATYKVIGGLVIHTAWMGLVALLTGSRWGAGWGWLAVAALPGVAVATLLAWERERAVLATVRSYLAWQTLSPRAARALIGQRAGLARLMDETYAWLHGQESL